MKNVKKRFRMFLNKKKQKGKEIVLRLYVFQSIRQKEK